MNHTFLVTTGIAALSFTASSLACSPAVPRSGTQIFKESAYVFHDTAIRAEAVFLKNEQGFVEEVPLVKVYWKVDKIYKGKNIGNRATVTNMICGGALVIVGAPYVVSLRPLQEGENKTADFSDLIGVLDDQGTISELQYPEKFERLVAEFKKLKTKK